MRHLAWLHAVPEGSKKSRLTLFKNVDPDSSFLQFPELEPGSEYIISLFQEAGLMLANGMGGSPLTWQEIESWLRTTELDLSVWEKLTIKEMSEAYAAELSHASTKDASAPYVPQVEVEEIDRKAVSDKIGSVLRGFKRKQEST